MSSSKRTQQEVNEATERKKQKVTQPQKLYGLYNQGATCYLNSVLQVLFMTPEIHDRLDRKSQPTEKELRNLFEKLKETTCGTEKVTRSLGIQNVHEQRDAAECLEMILGEVSGKVSEVLQGELEYVTKCSGDHIINEETNPFWTLPLPLKDAQSTAYSVEKGVKGVFATKSYSGHSMVFCNDCDEKRDATCACKMVKLPRILILLLKRFDFDYNTMSHVKSNCYVDVPPTLQIQDKYRYTLYGIVNHSGSLQSGHYTALILSNEDKTWYKFDDSHVAKAKDQPFEKNGTYISSSAYLLAYRASGSPKVKEQQDETRHVDGQRRRRGEHRLSEEREPFREKRQSQEIQREERRSESHRHQVRRSEYSDDKGEKRASTLNRDIRTESVPIKHKHTKSYSSKRHRDNRPTAETRYVSVNVEDEKSARRCGSLTEILKNPYVIIGIVAALALIVILPVVLTTVNRP